MQPAVSGHQQQRDRGRTTVAPPAAAWAEDSTTAISVWGLAALGRGRQQPAERPLVLHRHPDTELEFATRGLLWYAPLNVVCTAYCGMHRLMWYALLVSLQRVVQNLCSTYDTQHPWDSIKGVVLISILGALRAHFFMHL